MNFNFKASFPWCFPFNCSKTLILYRREPGQVAILSATGVLASINARILAAFFRRDLEFCASGVFVSMRMIIWVELPQERNSSQATFPLQKKHSQLHIFLQIVQRAIVAAAREMHSERFTGESGEPFEFDLAVVHAAHFRIKQRLSWLSLLLHAKPDILPHLCSSFSGDENEMVRSTSMFFLFF